MITEDIESLARDIVKHGSTVPRLHKLIAMVESLPIQMVTGSEALKGLMAKSRKIPLDQWCDKSEISTICTEVAEAMCQPSGEYLIREGKYGWEIFANLLNGDMAYQATTNVRVMANRFVDLLSGKVERPSSPSDRFEIERHAGHWEAVNTEDGEWEARFETEELAKTFLYAMNQPEVRPSPAEEMCP